MLCVTFDTLCGDGAYVAQRLKNQAFIGVFAFLTRRLTGHAGLLDWLMSLALHHRPRPPSFIRLAFPTCLPRRPRRRWQRPTVTRTASIGLRRLRSGSASPVLVVSRLISCGSSSFRPIGSIPGLLSPPNASRTGTGPFRHEPSIRRAGLSPASATLSLAASRRRGLFVGRQSNTIQSPRGQGGGIFIPTMPPTELGNDSWPGSTSISRLWP